MSHSASPSAPASLAVMSHHQKSETICVLTAALDGSVTEWANGIELRGFNQVLVQTFAKWDELSSFESVPQVLILDVADATIPERLIPWLAKIPTIVLSPEMNDDQVIQWHDWGVVDVLVKPVNQTYLTTRILNALEKGALINQLVQREQLLAASGVYDSDVRLFNPPYWEQLVYDALRKLPKRSGGELSRQYFSVVSVQLVSAITAQPVRFSESGCYKALADEMVSVCRGTDILGRFGSDYIGILLPVTHQHQAEILCQRLEAALTRVLPSTPKLGLVFRAIEIASADVTVPEVLAALSGPV